MSVLERVHCQQPHAFPGPFAWAGREGSHDGALVQQGGDGMERKGGDGMLADFSYLLVSYCDFTDLSKNRCIFYTITRSFLIILSASSVTLGGITRKNKIILQLQSGGICI